MFNLVPRLERMVLPFAIAFQAVPVVAFLPLGLLLLGRGVALAALVAGLVSFFPALVNVDTALRQTPRAATDLLTARTLTLLAANWLKEADFSRQYDRSTGADARMRRELAAGLEHGSPCE